MEFDVAIIGASSAGLFAAARLAAAGQRVAVFERQTALNHARRTYIITPQIRRVLADLPESAVLHVTPLIEVESPGASAVVVLRDPDLIVERRAMLTALAARAEAAGAMICYGHRFLGLRERAQGIEVQFGLREVVCTRVMARAVIGADGAFSPVARAAGLPRPPLVQILQAEIDLPQGWDPQLTKVWFDTRDTRYFYWLIPEGPERGALGVIGDDGSATRTILDRFLALQEVTPLAYQASHVAMYHPKLRPYTTLGRWPVVLAGDAAGQVKVTTVGGSVTGFYGAEAAAAIILGEATPSHALRHVNRELYLHWQIRRLIERFDNQGYDQMIKAVSPPIQRFLSERNRDEMAGAAWRIPLLEPRLAMLAVQALFKRSDLPELEPLTGDPLSQQVAHPVPSSAD
ncbi:MAG: FAD-dependent monooxygenase [Oscillochloridaceae bacterium umkhey_bin13]